MPDDPQAIPIVDEAVASAAYAAGGGGAAPARTPSRKQRWTMEQIDALVEGVEKNGLSAWRAIVSVGGCFCPCLFCIAHNSFVHSMHANLMPDLALS